MLTFEIGFADSHGAAISAHAVSQGHLGGPGTPIRAGAPKGRGFVEISANQGVAPDSPSRMLKFEIGVSESHVRAISVPAVSQRHLDIRESRRRAC